MSVAISICFNALRQKFETSKTTVLSQEGRRGPDKSGLFICDPTRTPEEQFYSTVGLMVEEKERMISHLQGQIKQLNSLKFEDVKEH